jgi:iron complex transport system substrate-binding protein
MKRTILAALCISLLAMSASAVDYTLGILGNANMDDTIDEKDIEYVEGVIKGAKVATNLSDANYDGKIDDDDIAQIGLIISGKEKELKIRDESERIVTLKMPLDRVVLARMGSGDEGLIAIGAADKVVGVSSGIKNFKPYIAEAGRWMDLPDVGYVYTHELDYEKIIELNPDIVFMEPQYVDEVSKNLPDTIPVIAFSLSVPDTQKVISGLKMLGVMFGKESEADKVVDWIQKYDSIIEERTRDLAPEEQPTFYLETYGDWITFGSDSGDGKAAAKCGGRNIIDDVGLFPQLDGGAYKVDPEWVLKQNPDVIFRRVRAQTDLVSEEKAKARILELENRTGWNELKAVENGQLYIYVAEMNLAVANIVGRCYFAKILQPELFSDLNPRKIADEYWNTFMGIEYPEMYVYPALS